MADDLDHDYARAGFGGGLGFGRRSALLVVDFVKAYLTPSSALYAGVESAVEPARQVLHAARAAAIPVVFTQVVLGHDGRDGGVFFRKVRALELFIGDSEMGAIVEELAPRDNELIVTKQYPSAFFGTSLASTLTSAAVDTVIVIGLSTSGCVRASVVDAMSHGFAPVVVRDAVGDRDVRPHEANLFDMQAKYADVLTADQVVAHLQTMEGQEDVDA